MVNVYSYTKNACQSKLANFKSFLQKSNNKVFASMLVMGVGQMMYRQWIKGLIYLSIQIGFVLYIVFKGATDLFGFFTLGRIMGSPWLGIEGDNSVVMLIMGLFAWILVALYIALYVGNIKDVFHTQLLVESGKKPPKFKAEFAQLFDKNFYKTALALPVIGVCVFSILPIVFMVLISFTNYGGNVVPPALVDWVGFENFQKIISLTQFAPTFFKILNWNVIWAVLSTSINYLCGLGLALLLNKQCVKGKAFWRAFPILAYAIPGFITLIGFKFMFSYGGPINQLITSSGGVAIGFLDLDSKWISRLIGLGVNAWISIPSSMLLATGILSNMNKDMFEAARIDGASPFKQFIALTLPFVLFATTPVL
ncbi:MAG: sugar ABC transporter permease, partial [Clostridia bacterium]